MGVEVKQTLEREMGLTLEPAAVRLLTFSRLAEIQGGGDTTPTPTPTQEMTREATDSRQGDTDTATPGGTTGGDQQAADIHNALFGEMPRNGGILFTEVMGMLGMGKTRHRLSACWNEDIDS